MRWAPLSPLVAAVCLGIVGDRFSMPLDTRIWVEVILGCGVVAILTFRRERISSLAIIAAFWAIGGGWHHYWWTDRDRDDLSLSVTETPRSAWVRGVVRDAPGVRRGDRNPYGAGSEFEPGDRGRPRTRFLIDLTAISDGRQWHPVSGRASVIVLGDRGDIRAGEAIEAVGQLATFPEPLNPGEFDYRGFLRGQGVDLRLTVDDPAGLEVNPELRPGAFIAGLGKLRAWSRAQLVDRLDPGIEPLASAFLLGQRDRVEPEINDAFARTGTTHLLAISGLHLQVLALAMLLVARAIGLPRRTSYLTVGIMTIAYAVLVGPAPSVVRSTVMTVTFCVAAVLERSLRPANTLALAALVTLAFNPVYLFDVGCQLSFLAIAVLLWLVLPSSALVRRVFGSIRGRFYGPLLPLDELERKFQPLWRHRVRAIGAWVVNGIVASTVVWLAALPLVALRFHIVSPISILLNLPLIPITSAALLFGGLGLGLSAIWGPLGGPASWIAGWLLEITQSVVLWGVEQSWGHRFVAGPSGEWAMIFYAALGLGIIATTAAARTSQIGRLSRYGPWCFLTMWVSLRLILALVPARSAIPEAEVLAVGHGLAVLIRTPEGQTFLYDCGRMGDPTVGRRIIAPALWSQGIDRIDTVILSHADQDHYNGLPDLLDRFSIGSLRIPPGFGGPANPGAVQIIRSVRSRGIAVLTTSAPETWESAGVHFSVLHPPSGWYPESSDNARSLVLDIAYRDRHLLLTGDLEQLGLVELMAHPSPEPPPDVLLAPHHGGKSANPPSFYRWANPRSVVVSQRSLPPHSNDALSALEEQKLPLWRTWRDGAIRLQWLGSGITARGFLRRAKARTTNHRLSLGSGFIGLFPIASLPVWEASGTTRLVVGLTGFALGLVLWTLLLIVEYGAWVLVVPPRKRVRDEDFDEISRHHQFEPFDLIETRAVDGAKLAGRWYPAPGPQATGRTVLLLHGFADDSSAWEASRAALLNRQGWNVAALHSRGYGYSEGPHASFGGREAADVSTWLDALADRVAALDPALSFQPVLWGRSMGAAIAVRNAAEDDRPTALVLESPMVDLDSSVAAILRSRRLPFARLLARLITGRANKLAGVSLNHPRPIDVAPRVASAILVVHGALDTLVPIDDARRLADAFASPPCWLDVPGAGHINVMAVGGDELLERISAFLDEVTCGLLDASNLESTSTEMA